MVQVMGWGWLAACGNAAYGIRGILMLVLRG